MYSALSWAIKRQVLCEKTQNIFCWKGTTCLFLLKLLFLNLHFCNTHKKLFHNSVGNLFYRIDMFSQSSVESKSVKTDAVDEWKAWWSSGSPGSDETCGVLALEHWEEGICRILKQSITCDTSFCHPLCQPPWTSPNLRFIWLYTYSFFHLGDDSFL